MLDIQLPPRVTKIDRDSYNSYPTHTHLALLQQVRCAGVCFMSQYRSPADVCRATWPRLSAIIDLQVQDHPEPEVVWGDGLHLAQAADAIGCLLSSPKPSRNSHACGRNFVYLALSGRTLDP